jgi:signal transduction histidine kinase
MGKALQALIVEDSERDAELLVRELQRGGYNVSFDRVDTAAAMSAALEKQVWDVILSDYSMPAFDAPAALSLMRDKGFDRPFIIVSGTVGEETAVAAMKAGVHDYFLKGKLGPRLVAAIEREIREAAMRDERKVMQEQLLISDRMVSMGTLAAGVAHEINNPLAAVMANLDMAAQEISERSKKVGIAAEFAEVQAELHDAREAAERIRNLVRDLRIFSRSDEGKVGIVDLQRLMESTLRMAWHEIRHRARLVKNYAKTPAVEASDSRLGQVFLNLVINAAQAIPEGHVDSNEIRISTSTNGTGQVVVDISDTGAGMPPEVLRRLFTPFFTTKPAGLGTGLGLSICRRIVSELGGTIDVQSELGHGSTFRVSLPAARPRVGEDEGPLAPRETGSKRRGRILVVDDEPMISKVVQRALSPDHDVTTISNAEEVLRRIVAGERFDVILCDLLMPQMTGMDLHAELLRVEGDQAGRMVFLTGGAFTPRARAFLDEVPNHRIEKPFAAPHLRALISDRIV